MSIFGPRLDRPSVVGDEGRPRATSLTIAAAVVVGLALATFHHLDALGLTSTIGFAIGIYVSGMALLRRQRVRNKVVGHFLFHAGAAMVVLALFEGFVRPPSNVVFGGFVLAFFGLAATWANVFTREGLEEVTKTAPISYLAMLLVLVVSAIAIQVGRLIVGHLGGLFASSDPSTSLFGFLVWVVVAAVVVRGAIWAVPLHELLPRRNRPELQRRLERLSRTAVNVGAAGVGATLVVGYIGSASIDRLAASNLAVELLLVGLSSPPVVGSLAATSVVVAVASLVALVASKAADMLADGNDELLAGATAGLLVALFLTFLVWLASFIPWGGDILVLGLGVLVALALVASLLLLVGNAIGMAAMDVGLLPDRAAGPATCAVGLLIAAVGGGHWGLPAPIVFGCAAGAILVWDLSTFGLGLTVELGHRPDTRRLELYHGLLSVGVGAAAVVAATGLLRVRRAVDPSIGAWSAVALAAFGAMLLAFAASRRESEPRRDEH